MHSLSLKASAVGIGLVDRRRMDVHACLRREYLADRGVANAMARSTAMRLESSAGDLAIVNSLGSARGVGRRIG